eukprot:TRINITY_DN3848_c0_g1_i2.p1 TRINITY_DN3848_c0_g1~~TRINITY_DN3848_c0_g1_i2.p1  ORF type:complete len:376 (+),score=44.15 TRINITY_DN3848_c0_g1_i2:41-1129(+)
MRALLLSTVMLLTVGITLNRSTAYKKLSDSHPADNVVLQVSEAAAWDAEQADSDNRCQTSDEIYPGDWRNNEWMPKKCQLDGFAEEASRVECLRNKRLLLLGDSLGNHIFNYLSKGLVEIPVINGYSPEPEDCKRCPLTFAHPDAPNRWTLAKIWSNGASTPLPTDPFSLQLIGEADVIVVSQGIWDMGVRFCGPIGFFESLRAKLGYLKGAAKPGAQVMVWGLHWLQYTQMVKKRQNWAFLCNHVDKVRVYRNVIEEAASCANVTVVDVANVTRPFVASSYDGIHYNEGGGVAVKTQVLLNYICSSHPLMPREPRPCDPEPAMKRWLSIPEALKPCAKDVHGKRPPAQGCPYTIPNITRSW